MLLQIDILAVVPELLESPFAHSIMKRARDAGILSVRVIPLRPYGLGRHRQLDDYQYGGGAGMVLMPQPLASAIEDLQKTEPYDEIIYLTPDGDRFDQKMANMLSLKSRILLLCGHYKGIDERIRKLYVTREVSIGDYVLSGGEIAAAVVTDAIARLVPGVLGDESSALSDSFQDQLLAPPVYTRPRIFKGLEVPEVLMSGDHNRIDAWRQKKAEDKTRERRPDLLRGES